MAARSVTAPYRILSLIEMCSGALNGGRVDNGIGEVTARAAGWLEANPGRWFTVGEIIRDKDSGMVVTVGLALRPIRAAGYEAETINNRIYARTADPDGLPLSDFVTRSFVQRGDPLPMLKRDKFDWSLAELRRAADTAAEWLFPASRALAA